MVLHRFFGAGENAVEFLLIFLLHLLDCRTKQREDITDQLLGRNNFVVRRRHQDVERHIFCVEIDHARQSKPGDLQ
jgi:hypothetical protein